MAANPEGKIRGFFFKKKMYTINSRPPLPLLQNREEIKNKKQNNIAHFCPHRHPHRRARRESGKQTAQQASISQWLLMVVSEWPGAGWIFDCSSATQKLRNSFLYVRE